MKIEMVARNALIARLKSRLHEGQRTICEEFVAKGDAVHLLPVSYTHLDVYKRQRMSRQSLP